MKRGNGRFRVSLISVYTVTTALRCFVSPPFLRVAPSEECEQTSDTTMKEEREQERGRERDGWAACMHALERE